MAVIIRNMEKPKDCTECPTLNEYDECMPQPFFYGDWDKQYENCPVVDVEVMEEAGDE